MDADDTIQPYATEMLVARAEESGADLVIAHYNRITPPRPRSEASARPERPTKVQTFGFLLEGAMTKEGVCRRPDAGTSQLLLRCYVE